MVYMGIVFLSVIVLLVSVLLSTTGAITLFTSHNKRHVVQAANKRLWYAAIGYGIVFLFLFLIAMSNGFHPLFPAR